MTRTALTVVVVALAAVAACAQTQPGSLLSGDLRPPDRPDVSPPGAGRLVKLSFAGGSVADLCKQVAEAQGIRTVPRRAYDRQIGAFGIPGDPPPEFAAQMAPMMGPAGAGPVLSARDGLPPEAFRMALAAYTRVGLRPGWLIEPAKEESAANVEGGNAPGPRELVNERDGEVLPFVSFEAVTVADLLSQLFAHSRLPIVVAEGVPVPADAFPVHVENISVGDLLKRLAKDLQATAVPVYVAYDLTVDFQEYLEAVPDSEIEQAGQLANLWNQLSDEQKISLLNAAHERFKNLPPDQRAMMLDMAQLMVQGFGARLGTMAPEAHAQLMGQLGGIYGDMANWYGTLRPGDRSELAGLFGAMGQVFGGQQGGGSPRRR